MNKTVNCESEICRPHWNLNLLTPSDAFRPFYAKVMYNSSNLVIWELCPVIEIKFIEEHKNKSVLFVETIN